MRLYTGRNVHVPFTKRVICLKPKQDGNTILSMLVICFEYIVRLTVCSPADSCAITSSTCAILKFCVNHEKNRKTQSPKKSSKTLKNTYVSPHKLHVKSQGQNLYLCPSNLEGKQTLNFSDLLYFMLNIKSGNSALRMLSSRWKTIYVTYCLVSCVRISYAEVESSNLPRSILIKYDRLRTNVGMYEFNIIV